MDNCGPIVHLLRDCGSLSPGEKLAIVFDSTTRSMIPRFVAQAQILGAVVTTSEIPVASSHGIEPTAVAAAAMVNADLVVGLTAMSLAHTQARRIATDGGSRYLSLAEYSESLLTDPALMVDYRSQEANVRRVSDAFTAGSFVHVTSPAGTDIRLDIRGRAGNCCPGFVAAPGSLGSPPDIEANVSPVETESNGVVVVDASIPCREIGLLRAPLTLSVEQGRIVDFQSTDAALVTQVRALFERVGSDKSYILAECGVGLNPLARVTGCMLTDEGAAGCGHFGFGSNSTVGGQNSVSFHLDFVFRDVCVYVDGNQLVGREPS